MPTLPVEGEAIMSETDITTHDAGRTTRPSALGDLRFAGAIATGLVAGTLGLGALAAPLVRWRDWPSGLTQDQPTTVQLAKPATPRTANTARSHGRVPGTAAQLPGGASALTALGGPALGGTAGGAIGGPVAGGGFGLAAITAPASSRSGGGSGGGSSSGGGSGSTGNGGGSDSAGGSGAVVVGDVGSSAGTVRDTGTGFIAPNNSDSDADGIPDVYEAKNGLNPNDAADAVQPTGTGLSNLTQFHIRSLLADADSNHDGVLNGDDDSDGDGVSNATELRNGTDPANADSNGDATRGGGEAAAGDGSRAAVERVATPPPAAAVTTPPVTTTA